MTSAEPQERVATRDRSPSYPGIPLEAAIERARTVWEREKRNYAPMATLTKHWGYKSPKTGGATVTYSALKKFGLLDEQGRGATRQGRLTPLALDIILKPGHEEELRTAALSPKIHREFWDTYQNELPSDDTLTHLLITERGFTPGGASDFLREYRATLVFAKLDSAGTVSEEDKVGDEETGDREQIQRKPKGPGVLSIPVPIAGGQPIYVEGKFPVSEADWTQFIAVLTAMKPGLVADAGGADYPTRETFLPDPPDGDD